MRGEIHIHIIMRTLPIFSILAVVAGSFFSISCCHNSDSEAPELREVPAFADIPVVVEEEIPVTPAK